jgi:ABC-type sugar transport system ATPase subunit
MAASTINGVAKAFGGTVVLKGVDLSIPDGEFFTLLGPSGCEKIMLLRTVAGLIEPDAGRLLFDHEDVTRKPVHRRDVGQYLGARTRTTRTAEVNRSPSHLSGGSS